MPVPSLFLYTAASRLLTPFAGWILALRCRQGKEERGRLNERKGYASVARPNGRLVWLHGASIGESLVLLPLVERLIERGLQILVTTGTKSSAAILAQRLPAGAVHQYVPLDAPRFVARFLDHWRPDVAILAESELWPNLIGAVHARGAPLILVNARISERSLGRWLRVPDMASALFAKIDIVLAQTQEDAQRLIRLGANRVMATGNLKFDAPPLPADREALAKLTGQIGARPVWVAASTHPDEEAICLAAHNRLRAYTPNLLTILAPRDIKRGPALVALAQQAGCTAALRSAQTPIEPSTDVYVADTFGEMGLWYRLAGVAFMGKSLPGDHDPAWQYRHGGGQNPLEAAKLGVAILHGPSVANFVDIYDSLDHAGGGLKVIDADGIARALNALFANSAQMRAMARAASLAVKDLSGATDRVMAALEPYLVQMMVGDPQ